MFQPLLKRKWVSFPRTSFKILHFNVLADQLTSDAGFVGTSPEHLAWETRKERLFEVIAEQQPDIVSLVECDHYDDFWKPKMAEIGLISIGLVVKKSDTDPKLESESNSKQESNSEFTGDLTTSPKTHGVTLFFRASRFDCYDQSLSLDTLVAESPTPNLEVYSTDELNQTALIH